MRLIGKPVVLKLEGDPVGWARPRFSNGRGFTAEKQRDAKDNLQWSFLSQWKKPPISKGVPVEIDVTFNFRAKTKKEIGTPKVTKPDLDNLVKLILDAGNGILYADDAQVVRQTSRKVYSELPSTVISLKILEEETPWP